MNKMFFCCFKLTYSKVANSECVDHVCDGLWQLGPGRILCWRFIFGLQSKKRKVGEVIRARPAHWRVFGELQQKIEKTFVSDRIQINFFK